MDNEWDEYADGWDDDPAARAYAGAAFESLTKVLSASDETLTDARALDFGCGTGLLTERLVEAGARVTAVDNSLAMLGVVNTKISERGWRTVETATSLPDGPATFDLIVCSSVCAFLDDYPATVGELTARLDSGGLLVQWDWERTGDDDHGLSRQQIIGALTGAGLHDVTVETAFTVEIEGQAMAPLLGRGRRP